MDDILYYVIFAVLGGGGLYLYYINGKKTNPKSAAASADRQEDAEDNIGVRLLDNEHRRVTTVYMTKSEIESIRKDNKGDLGRQWNFYGEWLYRLTKRVIVDKTSKAITYYYEVTDIPKELNNPPSKLHRALTQEQVAKVYDVSAGGNVFEKYGQIIMFAIVVAVIMFLLISQYIQ